MTPTPLPPLLAKVQPPSLPPTEAITSVQLTGPSGAPLLAGNSSANLSCAASTGLVSRAVWTKDGQKVVEGPRVTLANNGTLLRISPLLPEDNGVFSCQLSNQVSSKSATFNMEVYRE